MALVVAGCEASSYQYRWNYFFDSILKPDNLILSGLWLTVSISVTSQIIGVVLGIFGARGKMSRLRPIRWLANT